MRVLFINQFYQPDSVATAQLLGDVAETLAAWGHQVTVICGENSEPQIGAAASPSSVQVVRVGCRAFSRAPGARMASYATFLANAAVAALQVPRPDVVVTLTTPPFTSLLGSLVRRLSKTARHYIWEMDMYPDVAADLGVIRAGGLASKLLTAIANGQRRKADGVIALGECMRSRLTAHGVAPERIRVCENWADASVVRPTPVPDGAVLRVLYSGNFGLAHEAATIQRAMDQLNGDARFRFVFNGSGPRRAELESFAAARRLRNVSFGSHLSKEDHAGALAGCSLGLVTQHPGCSGSVVPSKVYSLMAARRPYLFVGPRTATPALLVARFGCGWQVDPGDAPGLVRLLDQLAAEPQLIHRAAERAYAAFQRHYDLPAGVARIAAVLGVTPPVRTDAARILVA